MQTAVRRLFWTLQFILFAGEKAASNNGPSRSCSPLEKAEVLLCEAYTRWLLSQSDLLISLIPWPFSLHNKGESKEVKLMLQWKFIDWIHICNTRANYDFRYRLKNSKMKKNRLLKKDFIQNWFSKPPCLKGSNSLLLNENLTNDLPWPCLWITSLTGPDSSLLHTVCEPQNRLSLACFTCRSSCSRCPLSTCSESDPTQNAYKQMLLCYRMCLQEAVVGVGLQVRLSQDSMNKLLGQEWGTGMLTLSLPSQIL